MKPLLRSHLAPFVQIRPNDSFPNKSGSLCFLPIIGPYRQVKKSEKPNKLFLYQNANRQMDRQSDKQG